MLEPSSQNALALGAAAEHLVCADLLLSGYRAQLAGAGFPYDVIVDHAGHLIRVQVKASMRPKNVNMMGRAPRIAYNFNVRRRGKNGSKRLTDEDCDIIALVALDIRVTAYFPISESGMTCQLMPPGFEFAGKFKRRRHDSINGFPFAAALGRLA